MAEVFYTWSKVHTQTVMQRNSAVHEQPIYVTHIQAAHGQQSSLYLVVDAYNCIPDMKQLKLCSATI